MTLGVSRGRLSRPRGERVLWDVANFYKTLPFVKCGSMGTVPPDYVQVYIFNYL